MNLDLSIAKMIVSRGISRSNFDNFINPKLKFNSDPFVLHDMEKATLRVIKSIKENKKNWYSWRLRC